MKIALLADIHGNALALNRVLTAAANAGAQELLIAGDLVGYYYQSDEVLRLLNDWQWISIGGNHEAMLAQWHAGIDQDIIHKKYGSGLKIACEQLTSQQLQYLTTLPSRHELEIDGRSVLLCHGSPWDRDHYVYPDTDKIERRRMFSEGFDLVVYGHTHYPVLWQDSNCLVINPGSVGQPRDRKPGACWALWDTTKHEIILRRESYDCSSVVASCQIDFHLPYLANVLTRT